MNIPVLLTLLLIGLQEVENEERAESIIGGKYFGTLSLTTTVCIMFDTQYNTYLNCIGWPSTCMEFGTPNT